MAPAMAPTGVAGAVAQAGEAAQAGVEPEVPADLLPQLGDTAFNLWHSLGGVTKQNSPCGGSTWTLSNQQYEDANKISWYFWRLFESGQLRLQGGSASSTAAASSSLLMVFLTIVGMLFTPISWTSMAIRRARQPGTQCPLVRR